jgi:hypothetical protein
MFLKVLSSVLVVASGCAGCTIFYPTVQAGPKFRVRVEDRGRPIKGLRLKIADREAVTQADGVAVFSGMKSGLFLLTVGHDAGIPDGVNLDIQTQGPSDITVPLKWPVIAPVPVRSMKGIMQSPWSLPGPSQPLLSLDLLEGISGSVIENQHSDGTGRFNFINVAPGLYFLRVNPTRLKGGQQIEGMIAVAVDPSAPADSLDLELGWTSCGLGYTDRNKCSHSELEVEQLCGQVSDTTGAVIADADILLYDSGEMPKLIERMRSDGAGAFGPFKSVAGTYQLVVSSGGFTVLRRSVRLEPKGKVACRTPLQVNLGIAGVCSDVNAR